MTIWAIIYFPILLGFWVWRWLPAHRGAADYLEADREIWEHHKEIEGRPVAAEEEAA